MDKLVFVDFAPSARRQADKPDISSIVSQLKQHPGKWTCVAKGVRSPERYVDPLHQHLGVEVQCQKGELTKRAYGEGTVQTTDVWASWRADYVWKARNGK